MSADCRLPVVPRAWQAVNALLTMGPALGAASREPGVVVPRSERELLDFGIRARDHALEGWFGSRGRSYCTANICGGRCTGVSDAGCILQQWAVTARGSGNQLLLEYTLPNPVQPLRPSRFLEVRVDSATRLCRMVYGHLDHRPCPVHPEWLRRARESVGVEFVINSVQWVGYDAPPRSSSEEDNDVTDTPVTEKDPFTVPGAELCFKFAYLPAVLDFFLPEVGHAKQCDCITAPAYFRKAPRGTTISYIPEVAMPYQFFDEQGDIRATFAVIMPNSSRAEIHARDPPDSSYGLTCPPAAVDLAPAYVPRDCIGFFPEYHGSSTKCASCRSMARVVSNKAKRVQRQLQEGTHVTVHGESIFVPKTNNPAVLSATLGPYGKVCASTSPQWCTIQVPCM